MANETEKAISEEIAARSPFTAQDVYSAWENHRSFDLVLAGVEYCLTFGLGDLPLAISRLTKRATDGEPAKYIYCECPSCHATGLPELFIHRR